MGSLWPRKSCDTVATEAHETTATAAAAGRAWPHPATRRRSRCWAAGPSGSEIRAAALLLPVVVSRRLRPLRPVLLDLRVGGWARRAVVPRQRWRRAGRARVKGRGRALRVAVVHARDVAPREAAANPACAACLADGCFRGWARRGAGGWTATQRRWCCWPGWARCSSAPAGCLAGSRARSSRSPWPRSPTSGPGGAATAWCCACTTPSP